MRKSELKIRLQVYTEEMQSLQVMYPQIELFRQLAMKRQQCEALLQQGEKPTTPEPDDNQEPR